MVGSSAMVGWITKKGHAKIKQYYLQGTERDQVVPDQGELQLQKVPPVVALHGAMIYLAFQVKFTVKVPRRAVILAFSSAYPSKLGRLSKHDDKTTVIADFSNGIDPNMTMLILVLNVCVCNYTLTFKMLIFTFQGKHNVFVFLSRQNGNSIF